MGLSLVPLVEEFVFSPLCYTKNVLPSWDICFQIEFQCRPFQFMTENVESQILGQNKPSAKVPIRSIIVGVTCFTSDRGFVPENMTIWKVPSLHRRTEENRIHDGFRSMSIFPLRSFWFAFVLQYTLGVRRQHAQFTLEWLFPIRKWSRRNPGFAVGKRSSFFRQT